jgi:hypothetical protein
MRWTGTINVVGAAAISSEYRARATHVADGAKRYEFSGTTTPNP